MDILFEGMNGGEVIQLLRAEKAYEKIQVIFITALYPAGESILKEEGVQIARQDFHVLPKPFDNEKFLETVQNFVKSN